MIKFLKENGFPMTVIVKTQNDYEDPKNEFRGYYSTMTDENGNVLGEFCHSDLRARIHWVNGFFTALRLNNKIDIPEDKEQTLPDDKEQTFVVYEYNENASPGYRGSRFMTTYSPDRKYNDVDGKVNIVAKNVSESEAYRIINERRDVNTSAYLSSLPEELKSQDNIDFLTNLLKGN